MMLHYAKGIVAAGAAVLMFDCCNFGEPILFVIAEGDEITLWDLEIATYHAVPSARKELAVILKVSHMSLYSRPDHLSRAGAAASAFIRTHLVEA
ncbi:hypothetical protein ACI7BZ_13450 [Xanthobacter sp. AM11]|uniref:hypothetical protein n=1 Tax=Xanthobacter sp. AM11 TaxID=3380643 RepID=UPI0039BF568A